jgi:hypothetical protein
MTATIYYSGFAGGWGTNKHQPYGRAGEEVGGDGTDRGEYGGGVGEVEVAAECGYAAIHGGRVTGWTRLRFRHGPLIVAYDPHYVRLIR